VLAKLRQIIITHKTKRIETSYMEDMVRKKSVFIENGGYEALADCIEDLCAEGLLTPVKASGTNGRRPLLYNRYHIREEKKETDRHRLIAYHPRICTDYYSNHPLGHDEDIEYLDMLDAFLKDAGMYDTLNLPFSVNERSYQIFRDEKFLTSARGQEFCRRIGLQWGDLGCYPTFEPFFYVIYETVSPLNCLVVENKDSFFTLKKIFNRGGNWQKSALDLSDRQARVIDGVKLDMLIYGEGKKILHSLKFMEEIPDCRDTGITLYYFGDLDYEGISIYSGLAEAYPEYKIIPFVFLYRGLLKISPRPMVKKQRLNDLHLENFLKYFSAEETEVILSVLSQSMYIPQEALAYPFYLEECDRGA
jgi:hypothetical protein